MDRYFNKLRDGVELSVLGIKVILEKEGTIHIKESTDVKCTLEYNGKEFTTTIDEFSKTNKLVPIFPEQMLRNRTIRKVWSNYNKEKEAEQIRPL